MFRSKMRESMNREVEVRNFSKAAFLGVMEYLCLDGFTVSIDYVVELYQLADMYLLEGLKFYCKVIFEKGLRKRNASQLLLAMGNLSCPYDGLKVIYHEYLESKNLESKRKPAPIRIARLQLSSPLSLEDRNGCKLECVKYAESSAVQAELAGKKQGCALTKDDIRVSRFSGQCIEGVSFFQLFMYNI